MPCISGGVGTTDPNAHNVLSIRTSLSRSPWLVTINEQASTVHVFSASRVPCPISQFVHKISLDDRRNIPHLFKLFGDLQAFKLSTLGAILAAKFSPLFFVSVILR